MADSGEKELKATYRQLGKSGLRVSVPILGCMSFGDPGWAGGWVIGEDEALPLLKHAWDRGVTTWDTANVYSNGVSEKVIAKAIKKYNLPRNKLTILTKCLGVVHQTDTTTRTFMFPNLPNTRDYVNQSGLSRVAIFNAVEDSLARLETTYIDLLQIHRADPKVPFAETMEALHDLVKAGKVRYIGASSMWAWQFAEYQHIAEKNGWTKFISMQNHYSLLYREEEREVNPYCNFSGVGIIPWGPLADGLLARPLGAADTKRAEAGKGGPFERKLTKEDEEIIKRVEEVAKKKGWKLNQVALSWIGTKVASPIVGISSPQRLDDALIDDKVLTEEEIKYLEEPYVPKAVRGHA